MCKWLEAVFRKSLNKRSKVIALELQWIRGKWGQPKEDGGKPEGILICYPVGNC